MSANITNLDLSEFSFSDPGTDEGIRILDKIQAGEFNEAINEASACMAELLSSNEMSPVMDFLMRPDVSTIPKGVPFTARIQSEPSAMDALLSLSQETGLSVEKLLLVIEAVRDRLVMQDSVKKEIS